MSLMISAPLAGRCDLFHSARHPFFLLVEVLAYFHKGSFVLFFYSFFFLLMQLRLASYPMKRMVGNRSSGLVDEQRWEMVVPFNR